MHNRLSLALLCVTFTLVMLSGCNNANNSEQGNTNDLRAYFEALANMSKFNGEIYLERNGEVLIQETFQARDFPEFAAVRPGTMYHIASIRKLMNQYLILQNPPIPEFADIPLADWMNDSRVHPDWTLRMLLDHESGLPRGEAHEFGTRKYNLDETLELILSQPLRTEPGTEYYYSNFGYLLVDIALSQWFDSHPNQVFQQYVFEPLNLRNTMVHQDALQHGNIAIGIYYPEPENPQPAEREKFEQFESGDTYSSVTDLAKFVQAINAPAMMSDGIIEHAGAKRGYRSYLYRKIETDTTFVMLANTAAMPITQVIEDVKSLLEGGSVQLPQEIERTAIAFQPDVAETIAGDYILEINGQRLTLSCTENMLFVHETGDNEEKQPLYFESRTMLFSNPRSEDGFSIRYPQGAPELAVIGMGGAQFSMQRVSESECHDQGK